MFKKIAQLNDLPGGVTADEIEKIYGRDPMWSKVKSDKRWMEFLALCVLDKKNGTRIAATYKADGQYEGRA